MKLMAMEWHLELLCKFLHMFFSFVNNVKKYATKNVQYLCVICCASVMLVWHLEGNQKICSGSR